MYEYVFLVIKATAVRSQGIPAFWRRHNIILTMLTTLWHSHLQFSRTHRWVGYIFVCHQIWCSLSWMWSNWFMDRINGALSAYSYTGQQKVREHGSDAPRKWQTKMRKWCKLGKRGKKKEKEKENKEKKRQKENEEKLKEKEEEKENERRRGLRGGFKTQPPVDRRFRPVPGGCHCLEQ